MRGQRRKSLIWLFDVNVLVAMAESQHIFHESIPGWLAKREDKT
jgi:hypothetical protein